MKDDHQHDRATAGAPGDAGDGNDAKHDQPPSAHPSAHGSIATTVAAGSAAGILGAAAGPTVAVAAVQAVGFSSTGIVGGSWAASLMSATAIANGGGVSAGSAVAIMQSIGAVGALPAGLAAGAMVAGACATVGVGYGAYRLWRWARPAAGAAGAPGEKEKSA
jgi:hypothetical protein